MDLRFDPPPRPLGSLAPEPGVPWRGPQTVDAPMLTGGTLGAVVRYLRSATVLDSWMGYSQGSDWRSLHGIRRSRDPFGWTVLLACRCGRVPHALSDSHSGGGP